MRWSGVLLHRKAISSYMPTAGSLQGVQFGVFGLGNKQYEHFNAVGKRVHQAMESLGAHGLCRRGDGDDDDSIDDDFDKWCTELLAALDLQPQLLGARADTETEQVMATYRVEVLSGGQHASSWIPSFLQMSAGQG